MGSAPKRGRDHRRPHLAASWRAQARVVAGKAERMSLAERLERRAEEYLTRARLAGAIAGDAAALETVRVAHSRAELRWLALAAADTERLNTYHRADPGP